MQGWERALGALFDDLEGQAEAAFAHERSWEVLDRAETEFAGVDLAGRLLGSVGAEVSLEVSGPGRVAGRLARVAEAWCLLEGNGQEWLIPLTGLVVIDGLGSRSIPVEARSVTARLGLGSALRRLAGTGLPCRLWLIDGSTRDGHLGRVGADFVELHPPRAEPGSARPDRARPDRARSDGTRHPAPVLTMPWRAISAVQSRPL